MNPRYALALKIIGAIILMVLLALIFPPVMEFAEMGARDLRYLWWLVLLVLFAVWLIWGLGRKRK